VVFTTPAEAFATGFDATILRSKDAGQHWLQVMQDDRADNPIFGIARVPGRRRCRGRCVRPRLRLAGRHRLAHPGNPRGRHPGR
jgi:hypothetical protein